MSILTDAITGFNAKLTAAIDTINGVNSTINTRAKLVAANTLEAKASEDAARASKEALDAALATSPNSAALQVNLAASGGAGLVGFGATTVAASITRNVDFFGGGAAASAATNDAAFASAMTYLASVGGGTLIVSGGDYATSQPITSTASNIHLHLKRNAGIVYGATNLTAVKLTGAGCSVTGGKGRGFIGPAIWDGTNTSPTYGVIWMGGNFGYVNTRLLNVRKMGIWFKDVFDGTAEGCIIEANYPTAQWTDVETGHWGVLFDPASGEPAGNFRLTGNTIKGCVQGCMPANYGGGGVIRGFVATGNIFEGCWNHGIYCNTTNGAQITGNVFNRCQIAAVLSGDGNSFIGNAMYSPVVASGDARDVVGLSVRDGSRNIVSGNTFKGTLGASNTVCIDVRNVVGGVPMNGNIVAGNTIEITDGPGIAIRVQASGVYTASGNIVQGNTIICRGAADQGAISLFGPAGAGNAGNKVLDNCITLKGSGWGVYGVNQTFAEVLNNTVEYAWDSATPINVNTVAFVASTACAVDGNTSLIRAEWGANIYVYGLREYGANANNKLSRSRNAVSLAKAVGFGVAESVNSNLLMDEAGPGAPAKHAAIGSMWRRTDGGLGSTLYIKEAGTDASGWTAK
jgi:hypothetical protein